MSSEYAGDISPQEGWRLLSTDANAVLVDVRTPAEWTYVGIPDLGDIGKQPILVPWVEFPAMQFNGKFVEQVKGVVEAGAPVVLICRSGVRSRAAAMALTDAGLGPCYNIATGFEGDPDEQRHRGTASGWKADGLPWIQT